MSNNNNDYPLRIHCFFEKKRLITNTTCAVRGPNNSIWEKNIEWGGSLYFHLRFLTDEFHLIGHHSSFIVDATDAQALWGKNANWTLKYTYHIKKLIATNFSISPYASFIGEQGSRRQQLIIILLAFFPKRNDKV